MHQDLGLTDVTASSGSGGGCGCGGACGCGGHAAEQEVQRFAVTGMTCAHCVASVTEELGALDGVESVDVRLNPGAASTVSVHAARPLGTAEVRAAIEDAGYALTDA